MLFFMDKEHRVLIRTVVFFVRLGPVPWHLQQSQRSPCDVTATTFSFSKLFVLLCLLSVTGKKSPCILISIIFFQEAKRKKNENAMAAVVQCSDREGMFPVTRVMHLTGGRHGLADKTGPPVAIKIPCFFSRPWQWCSTPQTPTASALRCASPHAPKQMRQTPSASSLLQFSSPCALHFPASSKVRAARKKKKRPGPPPRAAATTHGPSTIWYQITRLSAAKLGCGEDRRNGCACADGAMQVAKFAGVASLFLAFVDGFLAPGIVSFHFISFFFLETLASSLFLFFLFETLASCISS